MMVYSFRVTHGLELEGRNLERKGPKELRQIVEQLRLTRRQHEIVSRRV